MQRFLKSTTGALILAILMNFSTTHRAHAIAAATGGGLLALTPLVFAIAGASYTVTEKATALFRPGKLGIILGLTVMALIILDEEGGAQLSFQPIDADAVARAELNPAETEAYAAEREEINAVVEQATQSLSQLCPGATESDCHARAEEIWAMESTMLSPDAVRAARKLMRAAL